MHYFTLIKNYTFVPFVPVWSTPIIYNLIWSATLKVFIQELGLLKYNCFKLFLFLKLNIYFYIPLHIFYSSCAFTDIVVNEYHKTSWSSTWEFSHVGGECKKFVLFQWSVSILFVESCGELDIILTRIIPAKMIDNTQTSNKKNTKWKQRVRIFKYITSFYFEYLGHMTSSIFERLDKQIQSVR